MLILMHIMQIKMNKCIIYKITEKGGTKSDGENDWEKRQTEKNSPPIRRGKSVMQKREG